MSCGYKHRRINERWPCLATVLRMAGAGVGGQQVASVRTTFLPRRPGYATDPPPARRRHPCPRHYAHHHCKHNRPPCYPHRPHHSHHSFPCRHICSSKVIIITVQLREVVNDVFFSWTQVWSFARLHTYTHHCMIDLLKGNDCFGIAIENSSLNARKYFLKIFYCPNIILMVVGNIVRDTTVRAVVTS